jgi:Flp pilus assembly pilin Flp
MAKQWRSQWGATAVEYALMVALIAVVVLGAVATLGQSIFGDDVEVLGNVLTRETGEEPETVDEPETGGGNGPPCDELPDEADPPPCT